MGFDAVLFLVSILGGGVAAVSGFGIGSLVTPMMASQCGAATAIAGVSIAHFLGTALRFYLWKRYINRQVLLTFGIASAAGGLLGAYCFTVFRNEILLIIFGALLILTGGLGVAGISERWRLTGLAAWTAGALSGMFGGLVGNQGGIRSAALLGFDLKGREFVATATGIALAVDIVRTPVYVLHQSQDLTAVWPLIAIASAGVLVGTEVGIRLLDKIPEKLFKKIVSLIVLLIGIFVIMKGL